MDRRSFIGRTALLAGAGVISYCDVQADEVSAESRELIFPKRLKKGDTIGLITPGSAMTGDAPEKVMKNMQNLGFKVMTSSNYNLRTGFVAGSDEQRRDDIHEMFSNSKVDGIVCGRGGYGTGRLLQMLDYELIRSNPKVFVGFSDITALHYAIQKQAGLVTYHGPVASSNFTSFTKSSFEQVLTTGAKASIQRPEAWASKSAESYQYRTLVAGSAEGQLIGGNLSIMCSLLGTPYDVDYSGKIVFIEEVGESLYRVDRMLTQLLNSGKLDRCAGVVLGIFASCRAKPGGVDDDGYVTLTRVLEDRLANLKVPVIYGLPIGHISDNATVPVGVRVSMDSASGKVEFLEKTVK